MDVSKEQVSQIIEQVITIVTTYGLDLLGALCILVIGLWLSGKAHGLVAKGLEKTKRIDATLIGFFSSLVKYAVIIFTVIAVLGQFGVQTASLLTVIGAAGLAIGLALQGTLSNLAAGVMLLIFRPFRVGDFIEAGGQSGTVQLLNLFFTEMATIDNVRIVVPNTDIWGKSIKNYASNATRRLDLTAGIAYEADMDQAIAVLTAMVERDSRILKDPAPLITVSELADSSVNILVRFWVGKDDYWTVRFETTKAIKDSLDAAGIGIPFPSRTVYMVGDKD